MKALLFSLAFTLSTAASAQAVIEAPTLAPGTPVSSAVEVQSLAPQLVAFAGGEANFQNLVNGLASGTPVNLVTGSQLVTFTPSGTMTVEQIAQTLESVRQSLIARGISTPTAQQLATALTGGTLVTPAGTTAVNPVVTATAPPAVAQSPAVAIQNTFGQAAAGASTSIRSQTSDSPFPRGISDTPPTVMAPQTPAPIATPPSTASIRTR